MNYIFGLSLDRIGFESDIIYNEYIPSINALNSSFQNSNVNSQNLSHSLRVRMELELNRVMLKDWRSGGGASYLILSSNRSIDRVTILIEQLRLASAFGGCCVWWPCGCHLFEGGAMCLCFICLREELRVGRVAVGNGLRARLLVPYAVRCRLKGSYLREAIVCLRDAACALCCHCHVLFSSVVNGLMRWIVFVCNALCAWTEWCVLSV